MNSEKEQFFSLKALPARLGVSEAAWALGFEAHEIPILVAAGLLKPLGHPPPNGAKFFATASLEDLRRDVKWLARATDAIVSYWRKKNSRARGCRDQIDKRKSERKAGGVRRIQPRTSLTTSQSRLENGAVTLKNDGIVALS